MTIAILLAVALTVFLCMPLRYRYLNEGKKGLTLLFKAIPTLMAAGFAAWAALRAPGADTYADLVFAGLCVCAAADVLLEIRFEVGGFLFFTGHMLYVLALSQYRSLSWWCLTAFVLAAVCLEYFLSHYTKEVPTQFIVLGLGVF